MSIIILHISFIKGLTEKCVAVLCTHYIEVREKIMYLTWPWVIASVLSPARPTGQTWAGWELPCLIPNPDKWLVQFSPKSYRLLAKSQLYKNKNKLSISANCNFWEIYLYICIYPISPPIYIYMCYIKN